MRAKRESYVPYKFHNRYKVGKYCSSILRDQVAVQRDVQVNAIWCMAAQHTDWPVYVVEPRHLVPFLIEPILGAHLPAEL
jgi:hypothetical protein